MFDLDSAEDVPFDAVRTGAELIRRILATAGLKCFPLLPGGKGVHVLVPLRSPHSLTFCSRLDASARSRRAGALCSGYEQARRTGRIFIGTRQP